jgi:hypothetical protein
LFGRGDPQKAEAAVAEILRDHGGGAMLADGGAMLAYGGGGPVVIICAAAGCLQASRGSGSSGRWHHPVNE